MRSLFILLFLSTSIIHSYGKQPRTSLSAFYVDTTVGEPWPKPQSIQTTSLKLAVHPAAFHFLVNSSGQTCDLLTSAFDRYYQLIFFPQTYLNYILNPKSGNNKKSYITKKNLNDLRDVPLLKRLNVHIQEPCDQYPSLESNESCKRIEIKFFHRSFFISLRRYTYD